MTDTPRIAFVMDALAGLSLKKDSTLAMIRAAQQRGWQVLTLGVEDMLLKEGVASGLVRPLTLTEPFFSQPVRQRARRATKLSD